MFQATRDQHGFSALMSTNLANVDRCIAHIRVFLTAGEKDPRLFPLTLLAREALNNAMVHGNKLAPDKQVTFHFRVNGNTFTLEIEDQGPGFDWQRHVGSTSAVEEESGRGHEIYRHFAKSLRYNDRGNILTLEYEG